jgi:hypothetical protein
MSTFVLHDESLNSHGYWMSTAGCDLSQFKKNPIMLWNHNSSWGDSRAEKLPIGHWENIHVKDGKIMADPVFDSDEFSQLIAKKVEEHTLRMASVGALPIEISENAKHIKPGQRYATITKWKLKEASIVNIGANDNAMVALYDKAGALLTLSDESRSILKPINYKKMNELIIKELNLSDGSDENAIVAGITALKDSVKTLTADKETLTKEIDALKLADQSDKKVRFTAEVEAAVKDGRINSNGKDHLLNMYDSNADAAEKFLASIPKPKSTYQQITNALDTQTSDLAEYEKLSWEDLDRSEKLATLKSKYPDLYEKKYKEKFDK